ncbi:unnamed protein product, partial [Leptidea sinapis]
MSSLQNPRVCIVGAGLGGITTAKSLKEKGISFTILESSAFFGGIWRYEPKVGNDEYGVPIHSSMYKHLRTNLPKPTMQLNGFPVPEDMRSYPTWDVYYNYVKEYVQHFDIEKYIRYSHYVHAITRANDSWKVKHKHLPTGNEYEHEFEYVILATGHFSKPQYPNIPGEHLFKGKIIHSHNYREPEPYTDRRVLTVGSGPSGMDISIDLAYFAKTVFHSHHSDLKHRTPFPKNYIQKPDIKEFDEKGVTFVDGSYEQIDHVVYCTGYEFDFSYLDETSGLEIRPKTVMPLYKLIVNINEPTLLIVGLIEKACIAARYTAALVAGDFELPSKEEMLKEWQQRYDYFKENGFSFSRFHFLAEKEDDYYKELSQESGIDRVPSVVTKIRLIDTHAKVENLYTYRSYEYKVIDDNTFLRIFENDVKYVEQENPFHNKYTNDTIRVIFEKQSKNMQLKMYECNFVKTRSNILPYALHMQLYCDRL